MKGDTVGSTNLHLACNDRLLVGAVHADLEVNEYSTRKGVTNKKLQVKMFSFNFSYIFPIIGIYRNCCFWHHNIHVLHVLYWHFSIKYQLISVLFRFGITQQENL